MAKWPGCSSMAILMMALAIPSSPVLVLRAGFTISSVVTSSNWLEIVMCPLMFFAAHVLGTGDTISDICCAVCVCSLFIANLYVRGAHLPCSRKLGFLLSILERLAPIYPASSRTGSSNVSIQQTGEHHDPGSQNWESTDWLTITPNIIPNSNNKKVQRATDP